MRKSSPQPIADVLKNVVEKLSQTKEKDSVKIFSVWPKVCGKEFARHTHSGDLKRGTLQVFVDESAWLYQANLQKEELLEALQKKIGKEKIQKIVFRIGNTKR